MLFLVEFPISMELLKASVDVFLDRSLGGVKLTALLHAACENKKICEALLRGLRKVFKYRSIFILTC